MTSTQRTTCFLLPPPVYLDDRTILVLMDGNERAKHKTPDGYKAGGKKLVELGRHLRLSTRTTRLVACVLSRGMVSRRSPRFFAELLEALVEFGAIVVGGGLPGVVIDIVGSLERLRAAGEHAAACADAFEAIAQATAQEQSPTLRISLAIDYGRDIALTTGATVIFRTGMPADGVVRTSGIDTAYHQVCHGTKTLWPDVTMAEIDQALEVAAGRRVPSFAPGFDVDFITSVARALASVPVTLARAQVHVPACVDLTVCTRSTAEETRRMLDGLFAPHASVEHFLTIVHTSPDSEIPEVYGREDQLRHVLRVVHPGQIVHSPVSGMSKEGFGAKGAEGDPKPQMSKEGFDVILAAGQQRKGWLLPPFPGLDCATVGPPGLSPFDIVQVISRATRDCIDNPPLFGAARSPNVVIDSPPRSSTALVRDAEWSFVERIMKWARTSGLFTDAEECKGAGNYVRTAYRLFSEEEVRATVAKYMLLVAVGDILFDQRFPGETPAAHKARLEVSTTYLRDSLASGRIQTPPNVAGAHLLATIAQQWSVLKNQFSRRASHVLFRQWLRALDDHYDASVREWSSDVVDNPLVHELGVGGERRHIATETILTRYVSLAPSAVGARIWELVQVRPREIYDMSPEMLELRIWLYLLDVNTIGAGLAFRSAVLTLEPTQVPSEGLSAFGRVLPLLDIRVRLANDASEFVKTMGADRDEGKTNSCALLVPKETTGVARASALMRAVPILRGVSRRIDAALNTEMDHLTRTWPNVGQWVARGRKLGVSAYEVGHYTTLDHETFALLLEAS